jgi:hypothetical protein
MKITKILAGSLLALAGLSILAPSAKANSTSYADGDLLLGFRQSGGSPAATQDYLIDIGSFASLPTSGSTTFSLGNIGADLTSLQSGWWTAGNLQFSVFGQDTNNGYIFIGNNTAAGQQALNSGAVNTASANISNVTDIAYSNHASTANSSVGFLESVGANKSYTSFQPGGINAFGKNFVTWNNSESAVTGRDYLSVYTVAGNGSAPASVVKGYFTLASTGDITYTVVPEPTTFTALSVGALLLGATLRRRRA